MEAVFNTAGQVMALARAPIKTVFLCVRFANCVFGRGHIAKVPANVKNFLHFADHHVFAPFKRF